MQRIALVWPGLLLSLTSLIAGCGEANSSPYDSLKWPGDGAASITLPATGAGQAYTFGSVVLCTSGERGITVSSVRPVNPTGGMTVRAFSLRPRDPNSGAMFGAEQMTLERAGFDPSATTVAGRCSKNAFSELGVELARGPGSGRTTALDIYYEGAGKQRFVRVPLSITLCSPTDSTPHCQKP